MTPSLDHDVARGQPAKKTKTKFIETAITRAAVLRTAVMWLAILTAADVLIRWLKIPSYILPPPSAVAHTFIAEFPWIAAHSWITIQEILGGFALAILLAIVIALLLVSFPLARRTFFPLLVSLQAFPKEALAPLLIMWLGFSMLPKILLAAAIAFFPILVAIIVGLEKFDPKLRLLAASMGASRTRTFFSFRAWDALPAFFGALRVGVTLAAVGAVLGEFLGSDNGIGYVVLSASRNLDGEMLYGSLVLLVALCIGFTAIIDRIERWLLPTTRAERLA
jgi:NitT/TauT family transport system permease protein